MNIRVLLSVLVFIELASMCRAQDRHSTKPTARDWSGYQDEAVRLLQEYVRTNTANPPGNESGAAEFFKKLFDEVGIPNTVYLYGKNRANIYAVLKGYGKERPLILLNHLDTVRADSSEWRVPPFSGEIVNGELWGRGALDMKDLGIAEALAMLILVREHIPLHRDIIFLGTADEEVDDTGSDWMIANHADLFKNAEYLITEGGPTLQYPNGMTLYEVGVGEKAPLWLRMTATGPGGHGSIPLQNSAPNRLARAMARIANWQTPMRLLPFVEDFFRTIAPLESEPRATQFRNIRDALKDGVFAESLGSDSQYGWMLRDTVSLTVIRSGEQVNAIPDHAYCELDVRLLPGTTPQEFLQQIQKVVDDPLIKFESVSKFRQPNFSGTDTVLYRVIEETIHANDPKALVTPFLDHGFTESEMFRSLGIHSYGWNPFALPLDIERTKHAANERIPIEQFREGVRVFYGAVKKIAAER